jgi:NAD+ synthase (glutamine-hydrolysing)
MRIAIAQINLLVGDIEKNTDLIIQYIELARARDNAELIIFPELALTGYPPEDLLFRKALYKKVDLALDAIISASRGIGVVLGYPRRADGKLFNSCAWINNGKLLSNYDKIELPNYGVFDEKRYFTAGTKPCLIDLEGIPAALTICEDIWSPQPARLALDAGARLIININASPFHEDKAVEREAVLKDRYRETGLPVIYTNLVGGQDELVFDGGSMVMDTQGEIIFRAPSYEQGMYVVNLDKDKQGLPHFEVPHTVSTSAPPEEIIYRALVMAVGDYVRKNRFTGVVIGLSGGIDSALVTCLAVDALGKENVEVLLMPSRYTAAMSVNDSVKLADNLGIPHHIISIEQAFTAFVDVLEPLFRQLPADTTEENIQARCRGILLMAVSNKSRKLVLTTGNKSEMSVGYATLYGDMAGGYAPLKDVSKLLVYRLSRWRNTRSEVIPLRIIERPPSAELRHDQKDEDSLPPYEILDPILERYIEQDQSPQQIINDGFRRDDVIRVTRLVDQSEYKRRQAAPGVKITSRSFGRERRYPITSGYREESETD